MNSEKFRKIIFKHIKRYPLAQIGDLYKLTHQASMGSEHAVKDIQKAQYLLQCELEVMAENPFEPVIDEISPSGNIVRVHLWPYIHIGGDPDYLLWAFIKTANEFKGNINELLCTWGIIERMAELREIPYDPHELNLYINEMAQRNFPAVHHSEKYEQNYKPSYRVVALNYFTNDLLIKSRLL